MTVISLRQAHKMVEKINARLATLNITPQKSINIWTTGDATAAQAYTAAVAEFEEDTRRQLDMVLARADIRDTIRVVNAQTVDELVAQRKRALDVVGTLRHIAGAVSESAVSSADALSTKIQAAREAAKNSTSSYGSTDLITVSLMSPGRVKDLDKQIQAKQLEIERIEDALTTANSNGKVTIGSVTLKILQDEGLI